MGPTGTLSQKHVYDTDDTDGGSPKKRWYNHSNHNTRRPCCHRPCRMTKMLHYHHHQRHTGILNMVSSHSSNNSSNNSSNHHHISNHHDDKSNDQSPGPISPWIKSAVQTGKTKLDGMERALIVDFPLSFCQSCAIARVCGGYWRLSGSERSNKKKAQQQKEQDFATILAFFLPFFYCSPSMDWSSSSSSPASCNRFTNIARLPSTSAQPRCKRRLRNSATLCPFVSSSS
jgi:hypothetical protein